MTRARISGLLIAALLGYAAFQAGTASDKVTIAEAQVFDCPAVECATAFTMPPSSSLFL